MFLNIYKFWPSPDILVCRTTFLLPVYNPPAAEEYVIVQTDCPCINYIQVVKAIFHVTDS